MRPIRNLLLTGGWGHDFTDGAAALADALAPAGVASEIVSGADAAAGRLTGGGIDLLTVYACWSRLLDPGIDPAERRQWARSTSPVVRQAIGTYLGSGGGLLAVHCALLSFDDWAAWPGWVGAAWVPGTSWHPDVGTVEVERVDRHPMTAGIDRFVVVDEQYCGLAMAPDVAPLLVACGTGGRQPALWARQVDGTRVVCGSLGHDRRSLSDPVHARLLRRAARWVAGDTDAAVCATT